MLSYWEKERWLEKNDYCIIGAGIVGIQCALAIKKQSPNAKILIIERSTLPQGASTKNAGFACFGSAGELLADIEQIGEEATLDLIKKRYQGLELLRESIGDHTLDYNACGSYELFTTEENQSYQQILNRLSYVNDLILKATNLDNCFRMVPNTFGFKNGIKLIQNKYEGSIHTGKMMDALIQKAYTAGIRFLWGVSVKNWTETNTGLDIELKNYPPCETENLIITTNAFSSKLLPNIPVEPYRNQVLVTEPIPNLAFQATFHAMQGYVYFRSIQNRVLIGGARHLFMEQESTDQLGNTREVTDWLQQYLEENVLLHKVKIDYSWSGILAGGTNKTPIVQKVEPKVYCGVRLGGMGVAIGSLLGKELADLVSSQQ